MRAVITKITVWDQAALVERVRWWIHIEDGRSKYVSTRREACEWCDEMKIDWRSPVEA